MGTGHTAALATTLQAQWINQYKQKISKTANGPGNGMICSS